MIITSRNQLAGLAAADGARLLSLDVLPRDEAVAAADRPHRRAAGPPPNQRRSTRSHAVRAPAAGPGGRGGRAAARPGFPLAALAAELRDASRRAWTLWTVGDPAASVRAVFSWSYRQLSPTAARMFRLLGLHPGPDISVRAAASLAGTRTSRRPAACCASSPVIA